MKIEKFVIERTLSLYENLVDYNLSESDIHPYSLHKLLDKKEIDEILDLPLGYPQTNGIIPLRENIAKMYPGTGINNILVTSGSSEANFVAVWSHLNPEDEFIFMVPNFMQMWGIARSFGITTKKFSLKQELGWEPDFNELENLITPRVKMIAVCNPNNPTGHSLSKDSMRKIVQIAKEHDIWLYCDEVYRGAELNGQETPTFYGMYDKVIIASGLSKAYALPGLRLGWLVGPEDFIYRCWEFKDYTTISSSYLSHKIASYVLEPEKRKEVLNRNRKQIFDNLEILTSWLHTHPTLFSFKPPKAGGMAFIKYTFDMNSTQLSDELREKKSVLVVPGDCFGMDGYFRIGIGTKSEYLKEGLALIDEFLIEKNLC